MGWQEVSTHTKDKTPIQIETWVLSSIVGNKCTPLFRTEPRHLSADRCPRPTACWRCVQRSTQGEESDMQVLAQWSDDVSYPRRTADYVPVSTHTHMHEYMHVCVEYMCGFHHTLCVHNHDP